MHQRNDPSIFSPVSLLAFSQVKELSSYMVILGGSKRHREFVNSWDLDKKSKVIFIDSTSDNSLIHSFLDGIDVYAHSRLDGEVCSTALVEAMAHGKVIVSCPGNNNGHFDQIKNCGFFCNTLEEYVDSMNTLQNDEKKYKEMSDLSSLEYNKTYAYGSIENKILGLLKEIETI